MNGEEHLELMEGFIKERMACKYRDTTGMKKQVRKLFDYLEEMSLSVGEVRVKEAQDYQGWLIESGMKNGEKYASGSVQNFIKGALAFYEYLKKKGVVYMNPFQEIRRQRVRVKLPRHILKEKEMARLLARLGEYDRAEGFRNQRTKYRLHVLAELMYSTALRISEAASIKEEDIDFQRGVIEVRDIKSGHMRSVFLNDYAANVLKHYLEMRELVLEESNNKGLLFGAGAKRLIVQLNGEIKRLTEELGLPVMTSHGFRHAVGYHFLRAGCDIRYIQEILGHKCIRNTEIYTKVDKEALRKILDEHHPRQWKKVKME